jgi:RNA polymerase sigma-70 factor, ECF subfamily
MSGQPDNLPSALADAGVPADPRLATAWRDDRRYVLDIALRMLGDLGDAEDAVQEAFTRLFRADIDEIDDVRAWLVTVTSRLCLGQLRSPRRKRQTRLDSDDGREPAPLTAGAAGPPTPLRHDVDPADRVTLDDSVRLALQVMLQRLSPAERTAFVLHDVFQLSFDDIAGIVGRSPAACRQLASRARRQIRIDGPGRFSVESTEQRAVTERFIAACTTGNLDALLAVLDPDVSAEGDNALAWRELYRGWRRYALAVVALVLGRGGRVRRVVGRKRIARGAMWYLGPRFGTTLVSVPTPGDPSVLALRDGRAVALITLTVRDGLIAHAHAVADPAKLAPVTAALRR